MKISIITVCKNADAFIEKTVLSVLNQTYDNIEYIVIDGNSTDQTQSILSKYQQQISCLKSEDDRSMYEALNKGLKAATGEIVGFLHAGDYFENNQVLANIASYFYQDHLLDALYTDVCFVKDNKRVRYINPQKWSPTDFKKGLMPPHPGFYCKKKCYEQVGYFIENYEIAADFEYLIRLFSFDFVIQYVPILTVNMQTGGKSNNGFFSYYTKTIEIIRALKTHHIKTNKWIVLLRFLTKLNQFKTSIITT